MPCRVICLAASRAATTVKRSKSRTVGCTADDPRTEVAPTDATLTLTLVACLRQLGLGLAHLGATHRMFGVRSRAQALAVLARGRLSLGGSQRHTWATIRLANAA